MGNLDQERLALEELRRSYDVVSTSSNTLDQKAGALLGNASLITGLFGTLQIALFRSSQPRPYWVLLFLVVVGFLALVGLCTSVLWTKSYKIPVKADWNVISASLLQQSQGEAIRRVISSYIEYIPMNRKLNSEKANRVRVAYFILFSLIVLIIGLGVVQTR